MPRPKKPGAPEPKRRSRNGCWPCKARKVKCGEEKPFCVNCQRQGEQCDYSIRLNWEGRSRKKSTANSLSTSNHASSAFGTAVFVPANIGRGNGAVAGSSSSSGTGTASNSNSNPGSASAAGFVQVQPHQQQQRVQTKVPSKEYKDPSKVISPIFISQPLYHHPQTHPNPNDMQIYPSPPAASSKEEQLQSVTSNTFVSQQRPSPGYPSPSSSVLASPGPGSQVSSSFKGYFSIKNPQQPTSYHRQPSSPPTQALYNLQYDNNPNDDNQSGNASDRDIKRLRLNSQSNNSSHGNIESNTKPLSSHPLPSQLPLPPPPPSSSSSTYPDSNSSFQGDSNFTQALPPASTNSSTAPTSMFSPIGSISSTSEDLYTHFSPSSAGDNAQSPGDLQRVSVQSLLSHSINTGNLIGPTSHTDSSYHGIISDVISYGFDCGRSDLDVYRNDDSTAIQRTVPADVNMLSMFGPNSFGKDVKVDASVTTVFSKGGYYAKPVAINIPRYLAPLPSTLLENPVNLLYFHHFLNHTARILVPHDCYKNPFASVLPAMATEDTNLLNLLLAYSASHRARLLGHAEPFTRIAHWTRQVFPALRHALNDANDKISDTSLATAIMLVSLKIISPSTFEVPIPWESHLKLAREIFMARRETQPELTSGKVGSFLGRWLGYLDIFGSLSSRQTEPALFGGVYWSPDTPEEAMQHNKDFEIDCFTGFTPRSCSLLARLTELTHQCDNLQLDATGRLYTSWNPPPAVLTKAQKLLDDMNSASPGVSEMRTHHNNPAGLGMTALDESYRLAGVINLHRRIFRRSSSDPLITGLVDDLMRALDGVSRGDQEEVCAVFPIFTAGCESQDPQQREDILNRVRGFEDVGMKQIRRARKLMQKSWQEGLPWTVLANGEFLG